MTDELRFDSKKALERLDERIAEQMPAGAEVLMLRVETLNDAIKKEAALGKVDVLDKGFVRLVDFVGSDLSIVRAARVSFDADWRTGEDEKSDEKLIRYLMKNHHTSPFEAVVLTFEVKAPIFIFRQWHRHRTWSYNELSGRYGELSEEFYVPTPSVVGTQSTSNKQARDIKKEPLSREEIEQIDQETIKYDGVCRDAFATYRHLLACGWPRELARMCLPVSTYSRMFATVDLHNLFHFLRLRGHSHAQWEIQEYARAIISLIQPVCPVAVDAFLESLSG
jgi:thymidylate synthase (FAD)